MENTSNKNENLPRITPSATTFLDLLNNTYDDADLVHMLAEATDLTTTASGSSSFGFSSSSEEVNQNFNQPESTEFQNFNDNLDLVDEDAEYEEELIDFEGGLYDFGKYTEQNSDIFMEEGAFNGIDKDELQEVEQLLNDTEEKQMDDMEEDDDEKYLSDNFG